MASCQARIESPPVLPIGARAYLKDRRAGAPWSPARSGTAPRSRAAWVKGWANSASTASRSWWPSAWSHGILPTSSRLSRHYIVVDNPSGKREMFSTSCPLKEMLAELAEIAADHWIHAAVAAELAKDNPVGGVVPATGKGLSGLLMLLHQGRDGQGQAERTHLGVGHGLGFSGEPGLHDRDDDRHEPD